MSMWRRAPECEGDDGTVLILAMVFLLAIGLVAVATAGLAVGAGLNTSNARAQQITQANVESEASLAIQDARRNYDFQGCAGDACYAATGWSAPVNCTPSSGGLNNLEVVCEGTGGSHNNSPTRTVDFYVCGSNVAIASCPTSSPTQNALFAEAVYLDLPGGEALSDDQCSTASTATCGLTATVTAWDVRFADS